MTRDEIISMAREAGFVFIEQRDGSVLPEHSTLIESFAALVAAAEREACAKVSDERILEICGFRMSSSAEIGADVVRKRWLEIGRAIEREILGCTECTS